MSCIEMSCRLMLYCGVDQNEPLFPSWSDMFSGTGAPFSSHVNIYSFDGRDVITDPTWYTYIAVLCCVVLVQWCDVITDPTWYTYIAVLCCVLLVQWCDWHEMIDSDFNHLISFTRWRKLLLSNIRVRDRKMSSDSSLLEFVRYIQTNVIIILINVKW